LGLFKAQQSRKKFLRQTRKSIRRIQTSFEFFSCLAQERLFSILLRRVKNFFQKMTPVIFNEESKKRTPEA
jgi:hypothetical protein